MNKKLLQKVIDELKAEKPSLPYVLGMLETMMEMDSEPLNAMTLPGHILVPNQPTQYGGMNAAEQSAVLAEQGFVKGTKPGVVETNIVLNQ